MRRRVPCRSRTSYPSCRRSTHSSGVSPSTSAVRSTPLTLIVRPWSSRILFRIPAAEPAPDERSREIEQADQPNSPAAKLKGRGGPANDRHADRHVGDVGGQMQPDERYVKAADEEPTVSSQNASVANASCSPALEPSGMIMPRLVAPRFAQSVPFASLL